MRPTRVRSIPRLARSGSGDNRSGADQPRMKRRKGTSSVKSHNTKDSKSAASDRRTPAYGIVSDDFTGGLLVASYFEEAGIVCPVYFDPLVAKKDRPSDGIVIIVTRSRLEPVPEARRQIAVALDALDAIECESIGYKVCGTFDSTEQGNIGPAADLIAERYDQTPLFISGGFVEYGITVYNGHMFIRNDLISESLKRLDPVTPMPDPNLVRFLSLQTRTPVARGRARSLVRRQRGPGRRRAIGCLPSAVSGPRSEYSRRCQRRGDHREVAPMGPPKDWRRPLRRYNLDGRCRRPRNASQAWATRRCPKGGEIVVRHSRRRP
jgi:hypothetical protein